MIIGICGLIGSGKNTAAEYFIEQYGFRQDSFAAPLKDAVSVIFGWDREALEGATAESRAWREQVDPWWAERLNKPNLTPRWVLQQWGTDVLREHFHDDIWIASLEQRLSRSTENVVISDLRFPNEFGALRRLGATTIQVKRGPDPEWFEAARTVQTIPAVSPVAREALNTLRKAGVHESETAWAGQSVDYVVQNDATLEDLYGQLDRIYQAGLAITD